MRLEGSVTIVTGGSSGLGESAVREFLSQGSKVAIWDINKSLGSKLASELGANAMFCEVDVTSESSVETALKEVVSKFGRVDILLNSAGIILSRLTVSTKTVHPLEEFERVINVNLTGTFNVSRLVAKQMSKQELRNEERGVIIHVASIAAYEGQRGQCGYASSKGGVVGLTLPMARDLQSYKIRVNSIAPGIFMDTKILQKPPRQEYVQAMAREIPLGRGGKNEEFAHAVRFLAENTYMNGTVIRCDGGIRLPNI